jgi:hypothetical protein
MKTMTRLQNQESTALAPKRPTAVDRPTKEQLKQLESDLWSAADNLRANSALSPANMPRQYSG